MTSIKRYTAKRIIEELKRDNNISILQAFEVYKKKYKKNSHYQVWQEGFHPQAILNDITLKQKIEYIHFNPVKKGLTDEITNWKYSSACDYLLDKKGILEVVKL